MEKGRRIRKRRRFVLNSRLNGSVRIQVGEMLKRGAYIEILVQHSEEGDINQHYEGNDFKGIGMNLTPASPLLLLIIRPPRKLVSPLFTFIYGPRLFMRIIIVVVVDLVQFDNYLFYFHFSIVICILDVWYVYMFDYYYFFFGFKNVWECLRKFVIESFFFSFLESFLIKEELDRT